MLFIKYRYAHRGHFVLVDYYFTTYRICGDDVLQCGRGFPSAWREIIPRHRWDKYMIDLNYGVQLFINTKEMFSDRMFCMIRDVRQLEVYRRQVDQQMRTVKLLYYDENVQYEREGLWWRA